MCGRFTLTSPLPALIEVFDADDVDPDCGASTRPRYNIPPTEPILVLRRDGARRRFEMMRWGLVPGWENDAKSGPLRINARAESVASRPSFREAFRTRRCIVPADGFYEWKKLSNGKQPHYIRGADARPLGLAGIWESWGDALVSVSIITTEANEAVRPLHDRMPVILAAEAQALWLEPSASLDELAALLRPCPAERLVSHAVDRRVNHTDFDEPSAITPISGSGEPQLDLFRR